MQRLFWWLGGFDSATLLSEACRPLRSKYSSMGALVLLTALLAFCSGAYALASIFDNLPVTLAVALLWGAMILTLDRFLVSSTRKMAALVNYDPKAQATPPYTPRNPWAALVVRVAIASAIGLVVSKPIETRLLAPWIEQHERARNEARREAVERHPALIKLSETTAALTARLNAKDQEVAAKRLDAAREADGSGGTLRRGDGPIWTLKEQYYRDALSERGVIDAGLQAANLAYATERARIVAAVQADTSARQAERSIISDLGVIEEIHQEPGTRAVIARTVSVFLTLLFVLIECIPVLAKALSPFDAYDAALQQLEHGAILGSLAEARRSHLETMAFSGQP